MLRRSFLKLLGLSVPVVASSGPVAQSTCVANIACKRAKTVGIYESRYRLTKSSTYIVNENGRHGLCERSTTRILVSDKPLEVVRHAFVSDIMCDHKTTPHLALSLELLSPGFIEANLTERWYETV